MSLNNTTIEWTDFTWNPLTGCLNNCSYCYARRLANGRLKKRYLENDLVLSSTDSTDPFSPRFWSDRLDDPKRVPKHFRSRNPYLPEGSAMVFTVDMGELFGPWVPKEWVNKILEVTRQYPQHVFQFLTKFPQTLKNFNFPSNAWVGTTVNTIDDLIRVNILAFKCEANLKYLSIEPLLGDILPEGKNLLPALKLIDWIIVGAQTGKGRKKNFPKTEWVQNIIRAAETYQILIFMKDNLFPFINLMKVQEFPETEVVQ